MTLDKCTSCGGKKGGERPEAATKKTRRVEGPVAASLEALVQLSLAFAGDLIDTDVRVEDAARLYRENLSDWLVRYYNG